MRDILTVLAGLVILALTAAVAVPPFVAWEDYRPTIDRALAAAVGAPARTEGAVEVRLLPTPRLRLERVTLGPEAGPSLQAADLASEVALGPLLRGEVQLVGAAIERAEARIPVGPDGRLRLPALGGDEGAPRVGLENLAVGQLLVTLVSPQTGRTDQVQAEAVRLSAPALAGPWRVDGRAGGAPFRLGTALPGRDGAVPLRLNLGGGTNPRLELDLRVALERAAGGVLPRATGTARLVAGPPAQDPDIAPVPLTAQAEIRSEGRTVAFENLSADIGEGSSALRLTGSGRLDADAPELSLALDGRRLDLDALLATPGGASLRGRVSAGGLPRPRIPLALDLSLGSLAVAGEEVTAIRLAGRLGPDGASLSRLDLSVPGQTVLALSGRGDGAAGAFAGQARVTSKASDRLAAFLRQVGVTSPLLQVLTGPAFEAEAGLSVSPPVVSLRNLRLEAGGATLTGALRLNGEASPRPRLDAQIATQGLDVAALPSLDRVLALGESLDVGLTLDARAVRYAGAGAGRILARLASEGAALRIEELGIEDLAGADAQVTGRLLPDGTGRIEGRVRAKRAAPLLDGLGAILSDAPLALVPAFVREGALDLALQSERTAPAAPGGPPGLRTTLRGSVAGGPFEAQAVSAEGATQALDVSLQTADTARWLGRADPLVAGRPSSLTLRGTRAGPDRFALTAGGDLAGLRLATTRPFAYLTRDDLLEAGEATLATADLRPALALLGGAPLTGAPVPAELRLDLARSGAAATLTAGGRVAGEPLQARVSGTGLRDLSGEATLGSLSLPAVLQALALGPVPEARPGAPWPAAPFAEARRPGLEGTIDLRVARLDLGLSLEARDARLTLAATRDGAAVRDLSASLAGGQVAGSATFGRAGRRVSVVAEGSLADVAIPELAGSGAPGGRLTASLALGGAGESPAALVANLAGEGRLSVARAELPSAAPDAVRRALDRALAESDPLNPRRLAEILDAELARAPLVAAEAAAPATVVNGVLRINPLRLPLAAGAWTGSLALDLRALALEMRGLLAAADGPKGWTGPPPAVALGWRGPLRAPRREADAGPLTNGLATLVLARELERIEAFETEANERARLQQRLGFERQRREDARRAAEDAARRAQEEAIRRAAEEKRAAEEAARRAREAQAEAERQARLRAQAEAEAARARAQAEAEAARERVRQEAEAARRAADDAAALRRLIDGGTLPALPPPIDIRPVTPAQGLRRE